MKVAQINSCVNYGSTGRIVVDLCRVLAKSDHDSLIAYGRGELPNDLKGYRTVNNAGLMSHILLSRFTDRSGFYSTADTRKLVEVLKQYSPDVIHLHNIHGYYLNVAILFDYLSKENIPVIWTLHDCWPFTGHCAYYDFTHCEKWITEGCKGKCPERNLYPRVWGLSQNKRNYDQKVELFTSVNRMTLVTPSEWLKNEVAKSFIKQYNTVVIPNGVDQNVFRVTESDLRVIYRIGRKKIILSVANYWNKYKGLDDLISLASMVDDNYIVVMIGVDKKQQQSIPENILGIEKTRNIRELAQWYSCADIFVNPTYVDNFPTTNIEALSCGTPVITYKTGGSIEALDSLTGMIINQGAVEELCDAIYAICEREKPVNACLQRAELFNKNKCFQEYIELYDSVL